MPHEGGERFRATFDHAPVGIAHLGLDGRFLLVNDCLCRITGYSRDELVGTSFAQLTHRDDVAADLEQWDRLRDGVADRQVVEKRYVRKDGSPVWVSVTRSLVRDGAGRPCYAISVAEDVTERRRDREAAAFLAEAGRALASSLDRESTLAAVARLAVPTIADWCAVHVAEADGSIRCAAVAHVDPAKVELAGELERRYPPRPEAPHGPPAVIRTGRAEFVPEVGDERLVAAARDPEHLAILRRLELRSYIGVPIVARGRAFGAIAFATSGSGRRYTEADLRLAEQLAERAANAFDHARLYGEAQRELAERRRVEDELRESQERLSLALRSARMGTWTRDLATGRVDWSPELEEIFGVPPGAFRGDEQAFLGHIHPEDRPAVAAAFEQAIRDRQEFQVEFRFRRPDGEVRWMLARGRAYYDAEGRAVRLAGVGMDATAGRQAEGARAHLAAIIEFSSDAIVGLTLDGVITSWNRGAERLLGWTEAEAVGRPITLIIPPDRIDEEERILARIARGEVVDHYETIRRAKDGRLLNISLTVSPIRDAAGRVVGASKVARDISERKRIERARAESEGLLRAVVETAVDGIIITDERGIIRTANPAVERLFGYPVRELIGRNVRLLMPEPHAGGHDPDRDDGPAAGRSRFIGIGGEVKGRRRDGTVFPIDLAVSETRLGDERIFTGIVRDITDRKRAEEALRAEKRALEVLNQVGATLAAELDQDRLIQSITDAATQLTRARFGSFFYNITNERGESYMLYTLSGAPREAFGRFPMPRNSPVFAPTFRGEGPVRSGDITKDPRYGQLEPRRGQPEGHLPVRSYLAVSVVSRTGEVIGGLFFGHPDPDVFDERAEAIAVGIASQAAVAIDNARLYEAMQRELDERRRAEQALRESEGRFRHMADNAPVLIWTAGPDGRTTYVNRPWLEFVGRPLEQELGLDRAGHVHPDDAVHRLSEFREALAARRPFKTEYRLRRHDGEWRWVFDHGLPLFTPDGTFTGYIGSCIDVTERRQAEEDLRTLTAQLDQRVQERTRQLQEANRELESFSYSVSHDLRAPLRHIAGYADLLLRRAGASLDDGSRRYVRIIAESAARAGQLVDDLLSFSRMGRAEMRDHAVDLGALAADVREELDDELEGRAVEWRIGPLPRVRGDPAMLRMVLRNLMGNAAKYTRGREPARIHVGAERRGGETVVFVRDNGVGFDMRYIDKLFGVFQRLHTDEQFEGTGIGLAHVRRIIHRHGGRTWAQGEPGRGATFCFSLPDPSAEAASP